MAKTKIIWITGISHCGGNEHLEKNFLPLCSRKKKKVSVIYPGKMLFNAPGIPIDNPDNILNIPEDHLKAKMTWVFEKIIEKIDILSKSKDVIIIKGHKLFRWEYRYFFAHAPEYLIKIKPDMLFSFVDGIVPILDRLKESSQFRFQNYSKEDICGWQQLEVDGTKEWAEMVGSPHFVIPSCEAPELLFNLVFDKNVHPAYVAVDMTHSLELKDQVEEFVLRLKKYFPALLNPYTVPFDYGDKDSSEEKHIVHMCLDWFVPQAKTAVGYYPIVGASQGKPHELGKAFILGKNVWVVYVPKQTNLFVETLTTRPIFRSEEEFFDFLRKRKQAKK